MPLEYTENGWAPERSYLGKLADKAKNWMRSSDDEAPGVLRSTPQPRSAPGRNATRAYGSPPAEMVQGSGHPLRWGGARKVEARPTGDATAYDRWADAIQEFEGWGDDTLSFKNNNPGNLKHAGQRGATGKDKQGHAIFPSYKEGRAALIAQLKLAAEGKSKNYTPDMTMGEFFGTYAEENQEEYSKFVQGKLGIDETTTIEQFIGRTK